MKMRLVRKKKAFVEGDKLRVRELEKEFRGNAKMAKWQKWQKLTSGNTKDAWQGLNIMMQEPPNLQ